MKVIVTVSGFYGGTWHEAGREPVEMPEKIARAFLPPHGDQLARPGSAVAAAPAVEARPARKRGG